MSRLATARIAVRSHPRHLVLAAAVAGLLLGPRWPAALPLVAVALALMALGAGPRHADAHAAGLALTVALVALAGGLVSAARLDALTRTQLAPSFGHVERAGAILLERPRATPFGGESALVRLHGEPVLLQAGERVGFPRNAAVGDELAVLGGLRAPGEFARGRRAHAEWRAEQVVFTGRRRSGVTGMVDAVRRRAEAALTQGDLPAAQAALMKGMVLGQDDALPPGTRDDFKATGLTHLVAASGQNVLLLSVLAVAVASALGAGLVARWLAVLALIALYVPLAGGGPSIQRAGVMGAVGVVALLAGRPSSRWYALGLAACVTLTFDPRSAADPGWQLSFVAVFALLALAPGWRDRLTRRGAPRAAAEALAATAAATLATAPLIAVHFERVSLVSVPANLLAAVAVAPVMWLGLLAAAIGQVSLLPAGWLDAVAAYPLGYLTGIAHVGARVPHAQVAAGPGAVVVGVTAIGVVVRSPSMIRRLGRTWSRAAWPRRGLLTGLGAGAAMVAALALSGTVRALRPVRTLPPAGLRVTFLDVGQGDATLLQDGRNSALVDAGLPDAGIVARLRHAGVDRLDLLVATHAEADHVGGAAAVLAAMPVGLVLDGRDGVRTLEGDLLGRTAAQRRVRLVTPAAGQLLRIGALRLRVLSPRREPLATHLGDDPNHRAIVMEAQGRGARVLLPADAESDVLSGLGLRHADLLKVPHHGSADPGLPAVLERVRPGVAVMEVGRHNSYGHPTPATLAALRSVPAVFRTDRDGTVRADLVGRRWVLRTHQ